MSDLLSPTLLTKLKELVVSANCYAFWCHMFLLGIILVLTIFGFGIWLDYRQITLSGSISADEQALNAIYASIAKDSNEVAFLKDEEANLPAAETQAMGYSGAKTAPSGTIAVSDFGPTRIMGLTDIGKVKLQEIIQRSFSVGERLATYRSLKRDKEALLTDLRAKRDGIKSVRSVIPRGVWFLYGGLIACLVPFLLSAWRWWRNVQKPLNMILAGEAARQQASNVPHAEHTLLSGSQQDTRA